MEAIIEVNTSDFAIGTSPQILMTRGIGSCVAICLYEKQKQIGALLHIMLPAAGNDRVNPKRFADTALPLTITEFEKKGVKAEHLTAKLAGGAHMFKAFMQTNDIGARNVEAVRQLLQDYHIVLEGEDVGGSVGRSIRFDLSSGSVTIVTRV